MALADTVLLLLYAYAGFETLVVPAGEMDNPQRAVPGPCLLSHGCRHIGLCVGVLCGHRDIPGSART